MKFTTTIIIAKIAKNIKFMVSTRKYAREELEESIVEEDIDFKQIADSWNEYKLEDGHTFYMKPILTMISRTNKFNENGEPIYLIQSQVLSKTK